MQSPPLTRPPKRRITVYYHDKHGAQKSEERVVFWARGFGHYFKWGARTINVGPLDQVATVDYPLGT